MVFTRIRLGTLFKAWLTLQATGSQARLWAGIQPVPVNSLNPELIHEDYNGV